MPRPDVPRPKIHSSVGEWQAQVDARNASQKDDLQFQQQDTIKRLVRAVESLQKQMEGIRERVEVLEAEDHVQGVPYTGQ